MFNRFYRLEIHSLSLWTVVPMDEGTIFVYCCPSTFSLTPPPPLNVQYIQTVCVTVGGGGEMLNCAVDHILQEFYTLFLTRFRTYKIATPPQTKMTSKDDINGFVSLKFLRLCMYLLFIDFQGPPPSNGPSNGFAPIKIIQSKSHIKKTGTLVILCTQVWLQEYSVFFILVTDATLTLNPDY